MAFWYTYIVCDHLVYFSRFVMFGASKTLATLISKITLVSCEAQKFKVHFNHWGKSVLQRMPLLSLIYVSGFNGMHGRERPLHSTYFTRIFVYVMKKKLNSSSIPSYIYSLRVLWLWSDAAVKRTDLKVLSQRD
jgi:hypothetical protein